MKLNSPPVFRAEEYPDVPGKFLQVVNGALRDLYNVVAAIPERGATLGKVFTTPASGNAEVEVALTLDRRPQHVVVTDVEREDGSALTSAWSWQWSLKESSIVVSFIGLPASTKCRFSAEYF